MTARNPHNHIRPLSMTLACCGTMLCVCCRMTNSDCSCTTPPGFITAAQARDEGRGRRSAYLVVGQVRWCWMTMCTFAYLRRTDNARRVNSGWTGGELEKGRETEARRLVIEFSGIPGDRRWKFCG